MNATVTWSSYQFTVYTPGTDWNDVGGIYIFCGRTAENRWRPYYIGQADSFQRRLPNHDRWNEAARLGAGYIHAMAVPQEADRNRIERELIATYQPPLNTQLR